MKCAEKIRHATERAALDALREMKTYQRGRALRRLHVYRCPECGWYHVGHNRAPVKPTAERIQKPATAGQRRRAAERAAEQARRQAMFEDWRDTLRVLARMVDAEIARMEAVRGKLLS